MFPSSVLPSRLDVSEEVDNSREGWIAASVPQNRATASGLGLLPVRSCSGYAISASCRSHGALARKGLAYLAAG
jgi:hypothetical protein